MTLTVATEKDSFRALAEAAHAERLLNAYLRESGLRDAQGGVAGGGSGMASIPAVEGRQPGEACADPASLAAWLPADLLAGLRAQGEPLWLPLPLSGKAIACARAYTSPLGHHRYGPEFWVGARREKANDSEAFAWEAADFETLAEAVLGELAAASEEPAAGRAQAEAMLEQLRSSLANMQRYLALRLGGGRAAEIAPQSDAPGGGGAREAAAQTGAGRALHAGQPPAPRELTGPLRPGEAAGADGPAAPERALPGSAPAKAARAGTPAEASALLALRGAARTRAAERRLLYGHPFHPAPKSADGFSQEDASRYAPELAAAFALHYWAASPELVREEWIRDEAEPLFADDVLQAAARALPKEKRHYTLLPVHPWQSRYLNGLEPVRQALESGLLLALGPLGEPLAPTSSVRTVWEEKAPFIYKLPINVKITNFTRVNPPDQLKRSVDASLALAEAAAAVPERAFHVLLERGYRTVVLPGASGGPDEESARLTESFGVLFRYPFPSGDESGPTVVAGLLEAYPFVQPFPPAGGSHAASTTPLRDAVLRSASARGRRADGAFVHEWLARYADISLRPLLWLYLEYGISMEAHVQNSLVTLDEGWPAHFYARDLEGVSIGRERAAKRGRFMARLAADSDALYDDAQAWHRFKYYVLVNHMTHVIHTLAYESGESEAALWGVIRELVLTLRHERAADGEALPVLDDLLTASGWPAKANLLSNFRRHGDKPLYVDVPNPLRLAAEAAQADGDAGEKEGLR